MIKIVNRYGHAGHYSKLKTVYCGRGSALGNPFPINAENDRDAVCDKYQEWFDDQIAPLQNQRANQQLMNIERLEQEHGTVYLECFCAPQRCHCETIKAFIEGLA